MPLAPAHRSVLLSPTSRRATAAATPPTGLIVAALALATLVAALLRLPFLARGSFWFDETYTVGVVSAPTLGDLWDRVGATESTPPLFYLLARVWSELTGDVGEASLRTVSALALIAAVPATYAALRRLVGWAPALAAAALVAVSPMLVSYALNARAYGLVVLLGLLSAWALGALLEHPTPARWALFALAASAAIWTHWFAGFLVLAEVLALLWLRPELLRATLATAGVVLLTLVPLAGVLHAQTGDARAGFIADAPLTDRLEELVRQFALGPNVPRTWLEALGLLVALGTIVAGFAIALARARGSHAVARPAGELSEADGARTLLALVLVPLLVPLALSLSGLYDRFNTRNVLFLLPLAAGLAALALTRARALPLAALLALSLATSLWVRLDWAYGDPDWRGALATVERLAPGEPVIAATPLSAPVAALYLGRPAAAEPLATAGAWLVVEPARGPHDRELRPAAAAVEPQLTAAFTPARTLEHRGFRLVELRAPAPVMLDPAQLPGATLFAAGVGP